MQCKTERKRTCCFVIGIPVTVQTDVYVPFLHSFKDRITDRFVYKGIKRDWLKHDDVDWQYFRKSHVDTKQQDQLFVLL